MVWSWEIATDLQEVHELLCTSDAQQALMYGVPAPVRRLESTRRHVEAGATRILRQDGDAAGMFTLTWVPPFNEETARFPSRLKPAYLQRLVVSPRWRRGDSLVGPRCLRCAIEVAIDRGADALRAEANPDLKATRTFMQLLGFEQHGPTLTDGALRRIYLEKDLRLATGGSGALP